MFDCLCTFGIDASAQYKSILSMTGLSDCAVSGFPVLSWKPTADARPEDTAEYVDDGV